MPLNWGQLSEITKKAKPRTKNLPVLGRTIRAECSGMCVHDLASDDVSTPFCEKIKALGEQCLVDDDKASCFKLGVILKVHCINPTTENERDFYFPMPDQMVLQRGMTLEDLREQVISHLIAVFQEKMEEYNKNGSGYSVQNLQRVDLKLYPANPNPGGNEGVWYDVPNRMRKSANGIINPRPKGDKRIDRATLENERTQARNQCGLLALLGAITHARHGTPVALINKHPMGTKIKTGSTREKMDQIKKELWLPFKQSLWTPQDLILVEKKNPGLAISMFMYKQGDGSAHGVQPYRLSPKILDEGVTHVMMALVEPPKSVREDPKWNGVHHWVAFNQRGLNTLTNDKCWHPTQSSHDVTHTCPICLHRFHKRTGQTMEQFKKQMADHQFECKGMCQGAPQKITMPTKFDPDIDDPNKRDDILKFRHMHAEAEHDYTVVYDTEAFYKQTEAQLVPASAVNPTVMDAKNKLASVRAYLLFKGQIATHIGDKPFNGDFHSIYTGPGTDPGKEFIEWLLKVADEIKANYDSNRKVPELTPKEREHYESSTHCCICNNLLAEHDPDLDPDDASASERYTVIHHDHNTGEYIGAADNLFPLFAVIFCGLNCLLVCFQKRFQHVLQGFAVFVEHFQQHFALPSSLARGSGGKHPKNLFREQPDNLILEGF